MSMPMNRQPLVLFPSPNGRNVTIEISRDFFPGLEAFSARLVVQILLGPGLCRHVTSSAARRQFCYCPRARQRQLQPVSSDERLCSSLLVARMLMGPVPSFALNPG